MGGRRQWVRLATTQGASFAELLPAAADQPRTARLLSAAPWDGGVARGEPFSFAETELLAPVTPSKILCVGRNYVEHARELGNEVPKEPLYFFKPPSSLIGHGKTIVLPSESERVEHEAELALVIGKRARRIRAEDALSHVFGFTIALDITARDLQKKDGQWWRAKGFDTFCPTGPCITEGVDCSDVRIVCRVNDQVRQDGRTSQMAFNIPFLIAYASNVMTLEPGDLLLTGTPSGVGPLKAGDRIEVEIDRLGALRCDVG